jgi:intracellular sulfur oxidation DsrE/DsrF family protein
MDANPEAERLFLIPQPNFVMRNFSLIFVFVGLACNVWAQSPRRINPVVEEYGGIFPIPYAVERPDSTQVYKIVIEVEQVREKPHELSWAVNNVARLVNLHASAGVPRQNLEVVMVIHGEATYTAMNDEAHRAKFKVENPNKGLYTALEKAGVKIVICGQSLINRNVDRFKLLPEVKIATSMLTTLTHYQMKGYALLKF